MALGSLAEASKYFDGDLNVPDGNVPDVDLKPSDGDGGELYILPNAAW